MQQKPSTLQKIKNFLIGGARNPFDRAIFHNISLMAFFAWVGLGADGLSSSCYGPSEAFITLGKHYFLGLIVALATVFTIFVISESYSQIVELFPTGGGGYLVASRLLSPTVGMISGAALLIDYVLTITLSIASCADAFFSFLPHQLIPFKLLFAVAALVILIILNLRGVKESVAVLTPIFLTFVITHAVILIYALGLHFFDVPAVVRATSVDIGRSASELGIFGMLLLLIRAYSMGAGTYTGIEAVSNGMAILKEPRVETAKRTMKYMVISLGSVVLGLMIAYTLFGVEPVYGKTLNAVLFDKVLGGWSNFGYVIILITLLSEAAILFVAAQTGFIDGPRVLSNMAADRWVPKRFAHLSDRLVTMNGVLIMGISSVLLMVLTKGSVGYLVVLYSINVFITFCLSQTGMVKHWWQTREEKGWKRKLAINGIGLFLTFFILIIMTVVKFQEGGWITLLITGTIIMLMYIIKKSYEMADRHIKALDTIIGEVESPGLIPQIPLCGRRETKPDAEEKVAVFLVKDFKGAGIYTIFNFFKSFGGIFKKFIFIQVGLIDTVAFKSSDVLDKFKGKVQGEVDRYVKLMERQGYSTEGFAFFGTDTIDEITKAAAKILETHPNAIFFGGQIVFPENPILSGFLHNDTLFAVQRRLYKDGVPLYIIPTVVNLL